MVDAVARQLVRISVIVLDGPALGADRVCAGVKRKEGDTSYGVMLDEDMDDEPPALPSLARRPAPRSATRLPKRYAQYSVTRPATYRTDRSPPPPAVAASSPPAPSAPPLQPAEKETLAALFAEQRSAASSLSPPPRETVWLGEADARARRLQALMQHPQPSSVSPLLEEVRVERSPTRRAPRAAPAPAPRKRGLLR